MKKPIIILDPGHGGINPLTGKYVTPGKASRHEVDGSFYYEGVGNRKFAKEWAKILRTHGYRVEFTVDPDNWKDVPLYKRTAKVNQMAAQHDVILFSIHSNGAASPHARGHEAFTFFGESEADKIAQIWLETFHARFPHVPLRKDMTDGDLDKEANFAVVRDTSCPAVLIELLFHTNDDDVRKLRDQNFQVQTGLVLADTLNLYLEELC